MVQGMNLKPTNDDSFKKERQSGGNKPTASSNKKTNWIKYGLTGLLLIVVFFIIIYFIGVYRASNDATDGVDEVRNPTEEMLDEMGITANEFNASLMANDYIKYDPYSKLGLKDRLLEEGVPVEALDYAIESVDVNWNEQAVLAGQRYIGYTAPEVTRQGFIEQLEEEKYTKDEISYALSEIDIERVVSEYESQQDQDQDVDDE